MTEQQKVNVLKPAIVLTVAIAIGWAVCFWPARMIDAESGVWWMSIAAVSCLVPGWIVVFLSGLAIFPNDLAAMMVQSMIRLFSVGSVAVVIRKLQPEFGIRDFFGWLIGFYLLSLAVEVWVLRKQKEKTSSQGTDQGVP